MYIFKIQMSLKSIMKHQQFQMMTIKYCLKKINQNNPRQPKVFKFLQYDIAQDLFQKRMNKEI